MTGLLRFLCIDLSKLLVSDISGPIEKLLKKLKNETYP